MWRVVSRPTLLRPPVLRTASVSGLWGVSVVSSEKSETLAPRRPGVVGLYSRTGVVSVPG